MKLQRDWSWLLQSAIIALLASWCSLLAARPRLPVMFTTLILTLLLGNTAHVSAAPFPGFSDSLKSIPAELRSWFDLPNYVHKIEKLAGIENKHMPLEVFTVPYVLLIQVRLQSLNTSSHRSHTTSNSSADMPIGRHEAGTFAFMAPVRHTLVLAITIVL